MKTNYFKKAIATASIFTLSLGVFGQIIPDGTYVIHNKTLNEVLSVDQTAEADIRVATPDIEGNDPFQQWSFVHTGNDIYNITNLGSSSLLGVADRWCGRFGNVRALSGADDGFDLRIVNADEPDTFLIEIAYDNACNFGSTNDPVRAFDIQNGASGAEIQTFDRDPGNSNQQFEITPPAPAAVLSVDEVSLLDFVDVYFSNELGLTIRASDNKKQNLSLEIYDTSGSTVYSKKLGNIDGNELNLNLDSFQPGVYFAKIQNEQNQSKVTKIVVF